MRNIKLVLQYEGTRYFGFCKQPKLPTVQGELERALKGLFLHEVKLTFASRTDAGVHALGQVVNFKISNTKIPIEDLANAINFRLPKDIRVLKAEEVGGDFNARYSSKSKEYEYQIFQGDQIPFYLSGFAYWERRKLDVGKMREIRDIFLGRHDFSSFSCNDKRKRQTIKEIFEISMLKKKVDFGNVLKVKFLGNGFLYKMVRCITAALVNGGLGKTDGRKALKILSSKGKVKFPYILPAHGLRLVKVDY